MKVKNKLRGQALKGQLERMFPSLTIFSNLDWDSVSKEYETTSIQISFPEYLQIKAENGDCPPYLFELAFFEMAAYDAQFSTKSFPHSPGVHLNPTALFLTLQFDVTRMLEDAEKGNVRVHEKEHVLCLYRNKNDEVNSMEMYEKDLLLLQHLEEGPQETNSFAKTHWDEYLTLVHQGLILDYSNN